MKRNWGLGLSVAMLAGCRGQNKQEEARLKMEMLLYALCSKMNGLIERKVQSCAATATADLLSQKCTFTFFKVNYLLFLVYFRANFVMAILVIL